jgi:hypothetical protein
MTVDRGHTTALHLKWVLETQLRDIAGVCRVCNGLTTIKRTCVSRAMFVPTLASTMTDMNDRMRNKTTTITILYILCGFKFQLLSYFWSH